MNNPVPKISGKNLTLNRIFYNKGNGTADFVCAGIYFLPEAYQLLLKIQFKSQSINRPPLGFATFVICFEDIFKRYLPRQHLAGIFKKIRLLHNKFPKPHKHIASLLKKLKTSDIIVVVLIVVVPIAAAHIEVPRIVITILGRRPNKTLAVITKN